MNEMGQFYSYLSAKNFIEPSMNINNRMNIGIARKENTTNEQN